MKIVYYNFENYIYKLTDQRIDKSYLRIQPPHLDAVKSVCLVYTSIIFQLLGT